MLPELFRSWTDAGVRFLILRNYENLPADIGNDLDVLVEPAQRELAETLLLSCAERHGYTLVNRVEFSPIAFFFVHGGARETLHIDLFTSLKWRGFDLLGPAVVLDQRVKSADFFIPHPLHETVLKLLTRLLYGGQVKQAYREDVAEQFENAPEQASAILAQALGARGTQRLLELVLVRDWSAVEAAAHRWRALLVIKQSIRTPRKVLVSLMDDCRRLLQRLLAPPGLTVVLYGSDPMQDAVAEGLKRRFAPIFKLTNGQLEQARFNLTLKAQMRRRLLMFRNFLVVLKPDETLARWTKRGSQNSGDARRRFADVEMLSYYVALEGASEDSVQTQTSALDAKHTEQVRAATAEEAVHEVAEYIYTYLARRAVRRRRGTSDQ